MRRPSLSTLRQLGWIAAIAIVGAAPGRHLEAADRVDWLTGPALQRQLGEPVDVLWADNPLRQAISRLSRACRVAVLIDRRVDPGQKLNVSLRGVSFESALQSVARDRGLGVTRLGSVVYLGPRSAAERLRGAAAALDKETRRLPVAAQRKFRESRPLAWEDLATPRELLVGLAQQGGVEIVNPDRTPHDLWAAADLPPLSLVDRLTLVAFQFDLTLRVTPGDRRLELVPLPQKLPAAPQHDRSRAGSRAVAPGRPAKSPAAQDRFQINVKEKPLGPVLRQLAARLDLDLRMDEQAIRKSGVSLDQRVSVRLENATVDELFEGLLRSTGLTFHRRLKVVEIVPAE
ncbi:MAG: STN domain-containing protein [Thermoguttaceae bacterium]